ncbi:MAG: hypothetical protein MUC43_18005 [Pirellula sp.]|jgi:hypothetical protein|nr:hypothetical protein [Pirellula sp.]
MPIAIAKTEYRYDSTVTRVERIEYTATISSPNNWTLVSSVEYLGDTQNPTGYSLTLQETVFSASGNATKKTVYVVGHDQISQTIYLPEAGAYVS